MKSFSENLFNKYVVRYALIGFLIGLFFPAIATVIRLFEQQLSFSIRNIYLVSSDDRLMMIINFAPVVLMITGIMIGKKGDQVLLAVQKEADDKYKNLIEEAGDVVYIADGNGIFTFVNSRIEKMCGCKPEDLIGKHFTEMIEPSWKKTVSGFYTKQIKELIRETTFDFPIIGKNGNEKWVEQTLIIAIKNGRTDGFQAIVRDISERKKNLEMLKKSEMDLMEANENLDSFTRSVSHDLKSPVRIIGSLCEIIFSDHSNELSDDLKYILNQITRKTKNMTDLIQNLLQLSKINKAELFKSLPDMNKIVQDILEDIKMEKQFARHQITVSKLHNAPCDASLISQVWMNYIHNAFKYSSKKENPEIQISSVRHNNEIVYCVKDNGSGFDMKYYDKLFGVFNRLHSGVEFEGSGIGLSIVKRIINKHGGKIWAEGKPNEGATFYFSIPE